MAGSVLDRVRQLETPASEAEPGLVSEDETVTGNGHVEAEADVAIDKLEGQQPLHSKSQDTVRITTPGTTVGLGDIQVPSMSTSDLAPALDPLPESSHAPDSPTISLISALRQQISLLTDQSSDLNSKLIRQLELTSDLEDSLEQKKQAEAEKDELISKLEKDKAQWEDNMNTGLLVERGTVREEMQRLVEGLVEEERRRGSAEEGRRQVEQEVDDLSATLFEQANTMVATERYARSQAEGRSRQAEENLAAAEAAMRDMQLHLQSLPTLLPSADPTHETARSKYLAATVVHNEFTSFLNHLRYSKPHYLYAVQSQPSAPSIPTVVSQPFLIRATTEDVDPTLRLDSAPDLGWMNRKSIQNAITNGELIIEPISMNTLLSSTTYASHSGDIGCSMCGKSVFVKPPPSSQESLPPPTHPATTRPTSGRFSLKPFFGSPSTATSPIPSPTSSPNPGKASKPSLPPVFIFRVSVPSTSNEKEKENLGRLYPLCTSGWCLARLRSVCEWWRFIRTGIIEVIWKGEDGWVHPYRPKAIQSRKASDSTQIAAVGNDKRNTPPVSEAVLPPVETPVKAPESIERPELPPRKKNSWTLGFNRLGSGKGLGLNKGDTPPQSPTIEEVVVLADPAEQTPVNDSKTDSEDDVKKDKVESPTESQNDTVGDAHIDSLAVPNGSLHVESDMEDGGSAFQTPRSSNSILEPTHPTIELPTQAEDSQVDENANEAEDQINALPASALEPHVDLSSPRSSMDVTLAGRYSVDSLRPPPTPPRSTAHRAVPGPPAPLSPHAPTLPDRRAKAVIKEETSSLKSPLLPATPEPGHDNGMPVTPDNQVQLSGEATPQPMPKLVSRDSAQRASLFPGTSAPTSTGKRYVEGDSWEAKTWREIVKLKEDMWRARVGLVESD